MADQLETPMLLPPEAHVQPHGPVECLGLTFESDEARLVRTIAERVRNELRGHEH